MGKYDKVIGRLKRFEGEDPAYQEKVRAIKSAMKAEPDFKPYASHIAEMYRDIRIEEDAIDEVLSEIHLRKAAIEQLVIEQYENEAITSLGLEEGGSVRVQWEPYAKVTDRDQVRQWAIADGLERELQLPWMTLNALVKKRLLEGLPEPDGVEAQAKPKLVWTKG